MKANTILDEIDEGILQRIESNPGISVADAIAPFLTRRADTPLRQRVRALQLQQLIRVEKTKHTVRCFRENPAAEDGSDV